VRDITIGIRQSDISNRRNKFRINGNPISSIRKFITRIRSLIKGTETDRVEHSSNTSRSRSEFKSTESPKRKGKNNSNNKRKTGTSGRTHQRKLHK
jgi:ribosomal protein L19E